MKEQRRAFLNSVSHFNLEVNGGTLSPLIPILTLIHNISYASAGMLMASYHITNAVLQPFFGYINDIKPNKAQAAFGLIISALAMSMVGVAPNLAILTFIVACGGLGSGLFHPHATSSVSVAGSRRRTTLVSIFSAGGNLGVGAGALIAPLTLGFFGLNGTLVLLIPGLTMGIVLLRSSDLPLRMSSYSNFRTFLTLIGLRYGAVLRLLCVDTIRATVLVSITSFLPAYGVHLGMSLGSAGLLVFSFQAFGALGGLVGGFTADRFARKVVMTSSFALATPLILLFLNSSGLSSWIALFLVGTALFATIPVSIVAGHEILPEGKGLASSLSQGVAWSLGSSTLPIVGASIDAFGFYNTLIVLAFLPAIGGAVALSIPSSIVVKQLVKD